MKVVIFLLVCASMSLTGCETIDLPSDVPNCVKKLIRDSKGTPQEIWKYQYKKETVYLVIPACCDKYISLYSSNCNFICAPSGGFTGKGDGKCPNFNDEATGRVMIWKAD
jgi:hypothetical protein